MSLKGHHTKKQVRTSLGHIDAGHKSLARAYLKTLEMISNQSRCLRDLAMRALTWVTFASRQLTFEELQHALAVENDRLGIDESNLAQPAVRKVSKRGHRKPILQARVQGRKEELR